VPGDFATTKDAGLRKPERGIMSVGMKQRYTAVIKQDDGWWIGWIEEISGVNSQGKTRRELVKNLRSALKEALEMNREEARSAAKQDYEEEAILV
jgi:predicted RNase H-like HicB family nuclease